MIWFGGEKNDSNFLHVMRESKFEFRLTGSRYFGGKTADSDWDFLMKMEGGSINFLQKYQFEKKDTPSGMDITNPMMVHSTWEKKCPVPEQENPLEEYLAAEIPSQIHVMVVPHYMWVQRCNLEILLKRMMVFEGKTKEERRAFRNKRRKMMKK